MALSVCGINHKTAPLAVREKTAITQEKTPEILHNLLSLEAINEGVILSTCNRTEIYCDTQDPSFLINWLAQQQGVASEALQPHWYTFQQETAVQHIMRVASGLDSMVLGEPQILGQLKSAVAMAEESGAVGKLFSRLFQTVFSVTKQIRTHTAIGTSPVSVAYAAVIQAKQIFADLAKCRILLIGAGDTIELAALNFYRHGARRLVIANRTIEKAQAIANKFHGHAISMAEIPLYLPQTEVLVAATASELPILGKGMVESALKVRKHKPIFMVDLAIPRNIEVEVGSLEDVYLYNIDDLANIVDNSFKNRALAAQQAEAIIAIQAEHLMRELKILNAADVIRGYREKALQIRDKELAKALEALQNGADPKAIINNLSYNLTNKIIHDPTQKLRQAAYDGCSEFLMLAKRLFDV
jgi:glutamyl-tRNA reductase